MCQLMQHSGYKIVLIGGCIAVCPKIPRKILIETAYDICTVWVHFVTRKFFSQCNRIIDVLKECSFKIHKKGRRPAFGNNICTQRLHFKSNMNRYSTQLNSSHVKISYAVFGLKK